MMNKRDKISDLVLKALKRQRTKINNGITVVVPAGENKALNRVLGRTH